MKKSLRTAQEGVAHLLLIVVVVVLAAAGGAGYYVMTQQKANKVVSNLSTEQKEANSACVEAIDDKDFCAFVAGMSLDSSYTITMTSDKDSGVMISANDGKDNTRFTTKKGDKVVADMIYLDKVSYIYNIVDKSWTKYDNKTDATTDTTVDVETELNITEEDLKNDTTEYKSLGKEACGSLTCFKYQIVDKNAPKNETFVWFDDDEYKTRKMTFKDEDESTTMEYSYDAVTISKPSPVKEAPDYSKMTTEELQAQMENLMKQYGQ